MSHKIHALKIQIRLNLAEAKMLRECEDRHRLSPLKRRYFYHKRTGMVRSKARAYLLAYAFLRGRKYSQVEYKCRRSPDFRWVASIVREFGENRNYSNDILKWWGT